MTQHNEPGAKKIRIGLIYGGRSGEHEVSLNSAKSVIANINSDKYEVVPIAITNGQVAAGSRTNTHDRGREKHPG